MLETTGRSLSPCAEVNGDEVEAYLLSHNLASKARGIGTATSRISASLSCLHTAADALSGSHCPLGRLHLTDAPVNWACAAHHHHE